MKLFDSSPVIAILGNLNNPELFKLVILAGYQLYVPNKVVEEITQSPEKQNLLKMISDKEVNQLEPILETEFIAFRDRYYRLGKGECELILWAQIWQKENKTFCCIIDDKKARDVAEKFGLKCKGTIGLINNLKQKGLISQELQENFLKKLEEAGFRYRFK